MNNLSNVKGRVSLGETNLRSYETWRLLSHSKGFGARRGGETKGCITDNGSSTPPPFTKATHKPDICDIWHIRRQPWWRDALFVFSPYILIISLIIPRETNVLCCMYRDWHVCVCGVGRVCRGGARGFWYSCLQNASSFLWTKVVRL